MTNQEERLRELAKLVNIILREIYGQEMAFFMCVTSTGSKNNISDFIGNAKREDSIKWMEETLKRFKKNETIPVTEGNA